MDSLIELSDAFLSERKFDSAREIITKAEEFVIEKTGRESELYFKANFERGSILLAAGDLEGAKKQYIENKTGYEKLFGKSGKLYSKNLINIGGIFFRMGDYEKAESYFSEAKSRIQNLEKGDPGLFSKCLIWQGLTYTYSGKYEQAEEIYLIAKKLYEDELGTEDTNYIGTLNNLGILYKEIGEYKNAEAAYLAAKTVVDQSGGKKNERYLEVMTNLSALYFLMGNYEKAEPVFVEMKEVSEKQFGMERGEYGLRVANLASLYFRKKEFLKSEAFYAEALNIYENSLEKENPEYVRVLTERAILFHKRGKLEAAESDYIKVLKIREKTLGKEHPEYARILLNMGLFYLDNDRLEEAEPLLLEAKNIFETNFGTRNESYLKIAGVLSSFYQKKGAFEKAGFYFLEVEENQKYLLESASQHLSEKELSKYIAKNLEARYRYFSFIQKQRKFFDSAYDNLLFYKGFLLNGVGEMRRLADSDRESVQLFQQLKSYHRLLAYQYSLPTEQRQTSELAEKTNQLEKKIALKIAGFGEAIRQVTWQEVQSKLQPGEVAIEFVHYNFYNPNPTDSVMYAAVVLRSDSEQPEFIPLFEEESINAVLRNRNQKHTDFIKKTYTQNLADLIWKPLEKSLQGIKTIYFSPSGILHRINLGAISTNENQVLEERFNLVQVNSTRRLVLSDFSSSSTDDAVLFGGINYDFDLTQIFAANEDFISKNLIASRKEFEFTATDTTMRGGKRDYLKWTDIEVGANAEILQAAGFQTTLRTGYSATEEAFRQIGSTGESPRVMHLATHGFFYPDPKTTGGKAADGSGTVFKMSDHPMIRSGLILAGGNHVWEGNPAPENMEDGILTAYEISQMDLSNTELVVLSACETGLGDIVGNEGVYGLQRAFKIAGAKYLIMSLWQVPDFQTQELMFGFYSNWLEEKMTIREAFRAAKKEVRAQYPNPAFWAGFVLIE